MGDQHASPKHTKQQPDPLAVGACAGAAAGAAAAVTAVPVVQAIGFTAAGIAADSAAAGMMSTAAIAGGGGIAGGSAVAVLQGIGAAGAVPLGIAAATVAVPAAVGLGIAGIVKTCRSFQHEYVSAYEPRDPADHGKYWLVATEEGCGNVRVCRYSNECDARNAFGGIWCCRILYNPDGHEVACAGWWNGWALATIRRVMAEKYLSG